MVRLGPRLVVLHQRRSFEMARGSNTCFRCSLFLLQAYRGAENTAGPEAISCGLTTSKKIGNAICRNRVKRRLRAALRIVLPQYAIPGATYVFIAKRELMSCPWPELLLKMQEGVLFANKRLQGEGNERICRQNSCVLH
ncbi:MAG: ribonuclease P protein component [Holosporales bacterium]|jgi:ribonuclease P protein component|nr:ribonuclease P protein component [Holosporales bacterium]